ICRNVIRYSMMVARYHLAATVTEMLARIDELMASLREVSDNIAHDLRTPLNRLRVRAEHAVRDASNEDDLRDALAQTIDDADALVRTFNAMLLVAKLESGRAKIPDTSQVDIGELVADIVELYQPIADEQNAAIELAEPVAVAHVVGDRQLIGQAVTNLVENALKYGASTSGASIVRVAIVEDTPADAVNIVVSDNGRGIAADDRERALKRFVRLDESRSKAGSGLGLSLVAAIARAHAGKLILADNNPGLEVTLRLNAATQTRVASMKRRDNQPSVPRFQRAAL
ncbi:MAG: HAMP domain-containing sensor histidine kinase, partial [Pseudomonadota bacterium]